MRDISTVANQVLQETEKIIVGKRDKIQLIIMSVLADGHVLLDDLPGVGKTTLVKALSIALGCDSRRVQFVPDLLPSDICGMKIYDQKAGDFRLMQGPVMTNLLLADEINRAIPRTQSALLEAMEERQVTIDGTTYPLDVLMIMDNDWDLEIWCERKTATTIQITIYLWKHSAGTATHSAVSVKVALNAFDLP